MKIEKPSDGDYGPFYAPYLELLPDDGQLLEHLEVNLAETAEFVRDFSAEDLGRPHAPGEWTIKEILVHLIDTERVFTYRALRFARGDATPLPGFDQDAYVPVSQANQRTLEDILEEFASVRAATLTFARSLQSEALARAGTASGARLTVNAALWIIAGHELHHLASIRENYGH